MPKDYRARPERTILFTVSAWDAYCPQHIPQRFEATYVEAALRERDKTIEALEAEISPLREGATAPSQLSLKGPPAKAFALKE